MADELPLASLADLINRLDFTLDAAETLVATSALEDASELARFYGSVRWASAEVAPPMARTLVLRAAKRHVDNIQGMTTSRAGDETVQFPERDRPGTEMGNVYFDEDEQKMLGQLAGNVKLGFGTIPIVAWNTKLPPRLPGYVPVVGGERPFPLFPSPTDQW